MAMGTERSRALHNFTMPGELRWRNQRLLRCLKVNSTTAQISPPRRSTIDKSFSSDQLHHRHRNNSTQQPGSSRDTGIERDKDSSSESLHGSLKAGPTPPPASDVGRRFSDGGDGIAAIREKVMFDLQTAADKIKDAIFRDTFEDVKVSGSPPPPSPRAAAFEEGELHRPWNLRTRRAACKSSLSGRNGGPTIVGGQRDSGGGNGLMVGLANSNSGSSQIRARLAAGLDKSPTVRSGDETPAGCEKRERPKFTVALSKREIEEDFLAIVGHRPPRRPKKRAKIVQRELDVSIYRGPIEYKFSLMIYHRNLQITISLNFFFSFNLIFWADIISRALVDGNYT